MAISMKCPACGQSHTLPDYLAGFTAPCPCGAQLQVPRPGDVAAQIPELDSEGTLMDIELPSEPTLPLGASIPEGENFGTTIDPADIDSTSSPVDIDATTQPLTGLGADAGDMTLAAPTPLNVEQAQAESAEAEDTQRDDRLARLEALSSAQVASTDTAEIPPKKDPGDITAVPPSEPVEPRSLSDAGLIGVGAGDATIAAPTGGPLPDSASELVAYLTSPQARQRSSASEYYERGSSIARGGMGEIFLTRDRYLRREVVMKQMLDGLQADSLRAHRFIEEAQVTGQLEHPNIVPVHELGVTSDGNLYFTMKRVQGDALDKVIDEIRKGSASYVRDYGTVQRLGVFRAICNALAFAHSKGVLHRDLKPENIMIGAFGEVLVMDWGLSKVIGIDASATSAVSSARASSQEDIARTAAGQVFGTPKYMAPEQARGQNDQVDKRTDIYSLGAILYELLCLRQAFGSQGGKSSIFELMFKVGEGNFIPPGDGPDDQPVPVELQAIVLKAMSNLQQDRYQTVGELCEDIDAYLAGYGVSAHQDSPLQAAIKWAKRNKAASAAMVASILALVLGVVGMREYQQSKLEKQAKVLLQQATADREAGRLREAQQAIYQALGLAPTDDDIRIELSMIGIAIGKYRRAEERKQRLEAMRDRLAKALEEAKKQDKDADRRVWYEHWNRALNSARDFVRATRGKDPLAKQQLVDAARTLADRYRADRNFDIAETMIDEAAAYGLKKSLVEFERFRLREARGEQVKNDQRAVLSELARMRKREPGDVEYRAALAEVLKRSGPHVTQVLIPKVISGRVWEKRLAIEAIGKLGHAKVRSIVNNSAIPHHDTLHHRRYWPRDDDFAAPLFKLFEQLRAGWCGKDHVSGEKPRKLRLDAVQALTLQMLRSPLSHDSLEDHIRMARALGQLGDPRAARALALKRWGSTHGSPYWSRTAQAQRAMDREADGGGSGSGRTPEPEDDEGYYLRGLTRHACGRFADAIADYGQALQRKAEAPERRHALALALLDSSKAAEALKQAKRASSEEPDKPRYAQTLAVALHATGDTTGALKALDKLLAAHEEKAPADTHLLRAMLLIGASKDAEALTSLDKAVAADPMLVRAFATRGHLHLRAKRYDRAALDFAEVIDLAPGDAAAHAERGNALLRLGFLQSAFEALDTAIRIDPKQWKAYEYRAECWFAYFDVATRSERRKANRNALRDLDTTIELNGRAEASLFRRGQMRYESHRWSAAVEDFDRVLEVSPQRLDARLARARALERYGDLDRASSDLDQVVAAQADNIEARLLRGRIHRGKYRFDEALADFGALLAKDEEHHEARFQRAITLRKRGDVQFRTAQVQLAIAKQRGDAAAQQAALANAKKAEKAFRTDLTTAVEELTRIIRRRPRSPLQLYYRGQYRQQLGDDAGMLADYEQAIAVSTARWWERDNCMRIAFQFYLKRAQERANANDREGALSDAKKALKYAKELKKVKFMAPQMKQVIPQLENFIKQLGG